MTDITEELIDIPIEEDNILLKSSIYHSDSTPQKAPFVLNLPGLMDHRDSYFVKFYTEKFAEAGYYVLSYDYRAHGETAKQTGKNWLKLLDNIFFDLHKVIDWLFTNQSNRLWDDKLILFGRSLGAAIILTQGFKNSKAKLLIALCARYDYGKFHIKFPPNVIKHVSARYNLSKSPLNNERILIAHCRDDERIPFENMMSIKEHLGLSDENIITYNDGGHSFKGHREELFDKVLEFIKKHL
ncbi:MAG: alpha/beta hydrolase family protein [Promethearchaeota archaeon]